MFLLLLTIHPQEWVVRDVLPPQAQVAGSELFAQWGGVCGDLDGDLCTDGYETAREFPATADHVRLRWGPNAGHSVQYDAWPTAFVMGGGTSPRLALLNTPLGPVFVAGSSWYNFSLTAHLVRSPAVPIVISPITMPLAFTRADDMNGDGWEELFFQDYDGVDGFSGLMDGRTLTVIWRNTHLGYTYANMFSRNEAGPLPDMNGDMIPDYLAGWSIYSPTAGQWENSIMALSGADGSLLWENRDAFSRGIYIYPVSGRDFTGDGVQDICVSNAYRMKAISGSDGSTLWAYDPHSVLQSVARTGFTFTETHNPGCLTINPHNGNLEFVVLARYYKLATFNEYRIELVHFDPYTGTFLSLAATPEDLLPWFDETFQDQDNNTLTYALGDQDRDGLQELAFFSQAPNYDLHANGSTVKHLVTVGMRTLEVPSTAQVGSAFLASVSIPSAPLHDFAWVASRSFDRRSGTFLDGWATNLASGQLLSRTWTTRTFAGTLDAAGHGQLSVIIPADPALAGSLIYSRAVVLKPATGGVWTLSTLGITEIHP